MAKKKRPPKHPAQKKLPPKERPPMPLQRRKETDRLRPNPPAPGSSRWTGLALPIDD